MKPATFRELAAVEAKVFRALASLSLPDRKRVIESVVQQLDDVAGAPVEGQPSLLAEPQRIQLGKPVDPCTSLLYGGIPCALYAGHTGEHRS